MKAFERTVTVSCKPMRRMKLSVASPARIPVPAVKRACAAAISASALAILEARWPGMRTGSSTETCSCRAPSNTVRCPPAGWKWSKPTLGFGYAAMVLRSARAAATVSRSARSRGFRSRTKCATSASVNRGPGAFVAGAATSGVQASKVASAKKVLFPRRIMRRPPRA